MSTGMGRMLVGYVRYAGRCVWRVRPLQDAAQVLVVASL